MGIKRFLFNIFALSALAFIFPAFAEGMPPLNLKGLYEFKFSGVTFGNLGIESEQTPEHYTITTDIASTGIVKLFTRHSSHSTADATGAHFLYSDITYDTHYQTKNKKRAVKLVYKNGALASDVLDPPENPEKRPPVENALKKDAPDPLSLNIEMRRRLWDALQKNQSAFSLKVYDGRRLTQVNATLAGKKTIVYNGEKKYPVIALQVRRTLLAGFTKSELESYDPKEPTLFIYYSDDGRMIPVRFEIPFLFDKLSATLIKECRTGESCLLGIKE